MSLPKQLNFDMHRGDAREIPFTVVDENFDPIDITTATFIWALALLDTDSVEPQPTTDAALVTKEIGSGIVIVDALTGQGRVDIGSGDTTTRVAPLGYYHELQMILGGKPTTILYGSIALKRDIITPGP
jgi:hypothetical protein